MAVVQDTKRAESLIAPPIDHWGLSFARHLRVNDREAVLRKFRVKLRLKLLRASFSLGSRVTRLLISHSI